jgi:phosphoribosylformimino-5-aminoimidazole carboxamide ribotide isomerase
MDSAAQWFDLGVSRGVVGTLAVKDPIVAENICRQWPHRIIVVIDARQGRVAVEGWLEQTQTLPMDLAKEAETWGATAVLYTDIARDGTGEGPNVKATTDIQHELNIDVIASGGIGSLHHVRALADASVRSAVCGRALYSGAFSYADAMALLRGDDAR